MGEPTMKEYMTKTQDDYGLGIARPKFDEKARFELKGQFLKELRENTFSGTNGEDAVDHIEKFLEIVNSFTTPNETANQLLLHIFPITLTGHASKWFRDELDGSITTWVDLTEKFFDKYYLPSRTGRKKEVNEIDTDVECDPTNIKFAIWMASKFSNHLSDLEGKNVDKENEIAELFRIEAGIFHFETPLCKAFKDFNYLILIDMPWVADRPWLDYGPWMEPCDDIEHVCKSICFKNRHAKWPTCNWKKDGSCNRGDLPRMTWIGNMIYFEDYEWYEELEDGELKDEALNNKSILEGLMKVEKESRANNNDEIKENRECLDEHESMENKDNDIGDLGDYLILSEGPYFVNDEEDEKSKERRPPEEYVAIKEHEFDIWVRTKANVSHVYQDIFRKKDEG
ncbi:hypothetical protein Tco_1121566 [Tanacetum coccineum]|uniref:Retrotransposon gag domain-containing protein n=1 Tax=Tanacetum coccineum TaxID=301880 RepID=A0ABQ5IZ23_9ASTR